MFRTKIKATKIILRNIYYSLPSKNSITMEIGEETKLLPDSAFAYKPKSEKPIFLFWPSIPLETEP